VAGCCERGDESSGSCATKLVGVICTAYMYGSMPIAANRLALFLGNMTWLCKTVTCLYQTFLFSSRKKKQ
jgi:hypothetical protein